MRREGRAGVGKGGVVLPSQNLRVSLITLSSSSLVVRLETIDTVVVA